MTKSRTRKPGSAASQLPAAAAPSEHGSTAPRFLVTHKPPAPMELAADHPDQSRWHAEYLASMGTADAAFAGRLLGELINAACTGNANKPVSAAEINGAVAAMHGIAPKDEAEAMLAAQMVATHAAAMSLLRRLKGVENIPQQDSAGGLAVKLLRTYAAQLEALARYRGKGQQTVRVEHVTVQAGGQAIVGAVSANRGQGRGRDESERQPHAIAHAPGETLSGKVQAHRQAVPRARR